MCRPKQNPYTNVVIKVMTVLTNVNSECEDRTLQVRTLHACVHKLCIAFVVPILVLDDDYHSVIVNNEVHRHCLSSLSDQARGNR
jgi:hypothetical protein